MAYDPNNLSALAYANGYTDWHYWTHDAASEVEEIGYFSQASSMFRRGDKVTVNAEVGTADGKNAAMFVKRNDGSNVDVVKAHEWV